MASGNNINIGAFGAFNDRITATASGLAPGTYRFINTFVTATGKSESPMGIIRSQTVQAQTATPGTGAVSSTSNSVTFSLTNNDNTAANVT